MANYTITSIKTGKQTEVQFEYLSKLTDELDELHTSKKKLSESDIYKMTLWKVDRYPFIDDEKIKGINSLATIKTFDEDAKTKTIDVLKALLNTNGIGLPMASTYLRFVNPKVYQIIDVRAFRAAYDYVLQDKGYVYVQHDTQIEVYLNYLDQLHKIANDKNGYHGYSVAFENLDRFLYDFDKFVGYKLSDNPQMTTKEIEKKLKDFIAKQKERNKGGK